MKILFVSQLATCKNIKNKKARPFPQRAHHFLSRGLIHDWVIVKILGRKSWILSYTHKCNISVCLRNLGLQKSYLIYGSYDITILITIAILVRKPNSTPKVVGMDSPILEYF